MLKLLIWGGRLMADWQKIKTEYITTDISLRKLAQKYGVRYATVQERSKKEDWISMRDQFRTGTVSKAISKISCKQADKMARIDGVTDKLLRKLEQAVEELDLEIVKKKVKVDDGFTETTTETMEAIEGGIVDRAGLRHLTAALRDLKEIQMIKSELDRMEQEARIEKLRRDAQKDSADDKDKTVIVTIAGGEESWQS